MREHHLRTRHAGVAHQRQRAGACQKWGDRVSDGSYYNHYWVEIVTPQGWLGWVSAVYVSGGSNDGPVPGVPVETASSPVYCEYP